MLVGPSKYLKKILNMKLNRVKNPNWPEAKQLAIYKCGRGFELEATIPNPTGGQSGTSTWASELQVQCSNHLATLPPPNIMYF